MKADSDQAHLTRRIDGLQFEYSPLVEFSTAIDMEPGMLGLHGQFQLRRFNAGDAYLHIKEVLFGVRYVRVRRRGDLQDKPSRLISMHDGRMNNAIWTIM